MRIDANALITTDLRALRRDRRRHFRPALLLAVAVVTAIVALLGLRRDLWHQAPAQLAAQFGLWVFALGVMPAVGVGLWFPPRWLRVGLWLVAGGLAVVATLGPHITRPALPPPGIDPCMLATFGTGTVLLALAAISGALTLHRYGRGSVWVSAGITLAALDAIIWHCASTHVSHNLGSHLGAALVFFAVVAVLLRTVLRRRGT